MIKKLIPFIILLIFFPLLIFAVNEVQTLLSKAAPVPANIVINTSDELSPIERPWSAFAQGGEEPPPMLHPAVEKIKDLSPSYIRLDHIYDSYSIVKKTDNGYNYDFSRLDQTVTDILEANALPFLCLSYMPPEFTDSGKVIDIPRNWNDWQQLVKATIEHYSSKNYKNLNNVYYEVWNEPELRQFGEWKIGGNKDYRLLYFYANNGAREASNTNQFFFGGPGIGSYYPNWINGLASYVVQNNLRMDFFSWHRYSKNPSLFTTDANNTAKQLANYPKLANIPLHLTEWGIESENTQINNSNSAAAFTVFAASFFPSQLKYAYTFEIKDGPPPNGGKWGLLTHQNDNNPLSPKPRFKAFTALNMLNGNKLQLTGSGTFVGGLASKKENRIVAVLTNFDLSNRNTENVPVTFTGLAPATYKLKYTYTLDGTTGSFEMVSTTGNLNKSFPMQPNSILVLELTTSSALASFVPGKSNQSGDEALLLINNEPLLFVSPQFNLLATGSISFDIKPLWEKTDNTPFIVFDIPYSYNQKIYRLSLAKQKKNNINSLVYGINSNKEETSLSLPITGWDKNHWYHLETGWTADKIWFSIDGNKVEQANTINVSNGEILKFYQINAAIDNLVVTGDGKELIRRSFDGNVNR